MSQDIGDGCVCSATLHSVTGYSINGGLLDLFVGPDQVMTYTSAS